MHVVFLCVFFFFFSMLFVFTRDDSVIHEGKRCLKHIFIHQATGSFGHACPFVGRTQYELQNLGTFIRPPLQGSLGVLLPTVMVSIPVGGVMKL